MPQTLEPCDTTKATCPNRVVVLLHYAMRLGVVHKLRNFAKNQKSQLDMLFVSVRVEEDAMLFFQTPWHGAVHHGAVVLLHGAAYLHLNFFL